MALSATHYLNPLTDYWIKYRKILGKKNAYHKIYNGTSELFDEINQRRFTSAQFKFSSSLHDIQGEFRIKNGSEN